MDLNKVIKENNLKNGILVVDFMNDIYKVKISEKLELIPKSFNGPSSFYPDNFNGEEFTNYFEIIDTQ